MSKVNVNTIEPSTGTDITLGASGDTITVPSGATITNSGTSTGFGPTLTGSTNNQVVTVTGANAITGETNFIYNGTIIGGGADGANADLGVGLHIKTSDSGGSVSADGDELVLESAAGVGMTMLGGTGADLAIDFGDSGGSQRGRIIYANNGDNFIFHNAAAETMRISGDGYVTKPLQPAFFGNITSAVNNVTGDGTRYSYVPNELADRNNDFSTSTFTAPVAGLYLATISHNLAGISSMESGIGYIATSNRSHYWNFNPDNLANAAGSIGFSQSQICDMDASDTLVFEIKLTGGSKVADIEDTTTMAVWLLG